MAEIVKITKAQHAAITKYLESGKTNEQLLNSHSCGHADPAILAMDFDVLAAALYVGYEIQKDPAEILADLTQDLKDLRTEFLAMAERASKHYTSASYGSTWEAKCEATRDAYQDARRKLEQKMAKAGI